MKGNSAELTLTLDNCWAAGITNLLPTWLAPNLITLMGITGLIVAFLVSATMVPEIEGMAKQVPSQLLLESKSNVYPLPCQKLLHEIVYPLQAY